MNRRTKTTKARGSLGVSDLLRIFIMPKAACVAGWCGGGHLTFRPGSAAELALGDGEGAALAHLEVMLFALTSGTRSRGTLVVSS